MQLTQIPTDEQGRELTQFGTPMFPVAAYQNDISRFELGYVPWHWHSECEFAYVTHGALEVDFAGGNVVVEAGESVFVASDQVHAMRSATSAACRMDNIVFSPDIVSGSLYSVYHTKYVVPVLQNKEIGAIALRKTDPQNIPALEMLASAANTYASDAFSSEMRLRNILCEAWLRVAQTCSARNDAVSQQTGYIKKLLSFVHENYTEPITLEDIAKGAAVSPRTCSRAFKNQLGTTAMEYLRQYRVGKAAQMLLETDLPITDVCYACGFSNPSHFTTTMKSAMGLSPAAYRTQARSERREEQDAD